MHFDQPLSNLQQWFGEIDTSIEIIHEKERVFIFKYKAGSGKLSLSNIINFNIIATYNGAIEPKVQQAILCGMTSLGAVYETRLEHVESLPAMFDSNAAIPQCSLSKRSDWGTVEETITFPITKDTNGWFVELKFDKKWNRVDQWSCKMVSSDGTHFICNNLDYNGRQPSGSSLSVKYHVYYQQQAPKLLAAWFNSYHCTNH